MLTIRVEEKGDAPQVFSVVESAFGQPDEARLVERLRREADPYIGLVATRDDTVVGHIAFTPVNIDGWADHPRAAGLAPLAVQPSLQRQGVGSALVHAGLERCRADWFALVVVLGDPAYYARFGFEVARNHGLTSDYDEHEGAFRVVALTSGALHGARGHVRYHPAFA